MNSLRHVFRLAVGASLAALLAAGGASAHAAQSHGLILWIGDYEGTDSDLPGIDKDAALARQIARQIGVPDGQIVEVSNAQLKRRGMIDAFVALDQRVGKGDHVYIYYSGHGYQGKAKDSATCTEALVTHELSGLLDAELQAVLARLSQKAKQIVVMNDSCFSGGAATKSMRSADGAVAKVYTGAALRSAGNAGDVYQCGQAINTFTRNFGAERSSNQPNMVYLAASSDREVSFATPNGSLATVAWAGCLANGEADTDRSGTVTAEELRACAQRKIDSSGKKQTVSIVGDRNMPLSFMGGGVGAGGAEVGSASGNAGSPTGAVAALHDLVNGADRARRVSLQTSQSVYRIGQDFLSFSLTTDKPGYVYLLQAGSDGKPSTILFPNQYDSNNFVNAGTHQFPSAGSQLRLRSLGPAGTTHLMAIVVDKPANLQNLGSVSQGFRSIASTSSGFRNFGAEMAQSGGGSYGASQVVPVREQP
ncbi:MAG: DUF4384 domain-containing protein [Rhodoferax sp.]|nr:DUF4384 domain-containing protein [Rhodoferax sp.]